MQFYFSLGLAGWHAGAARGLREEDGERGAEAHRCGLRRVSGGQGGFHWNDQF